MKPLNAMVSAVEQKLRAWWDHQDQETPCLLLTSPADDPQPVPDTDDLDRYWFDVDEGLKRAMALIENRRYYGVALPYHWPDWGASTFAGVLGSRMEMVRKETFWAHPCCQRLEEVLDIDIVPQSRFYRTVMEMTRRSVAMSRDHHFVAVYPIVGVADILAGLYGTEPLLMAMAEQPLAVKAAMAHVKDLWLREFHAVQTLIDSAGNPGCMNWMAIWAPGRSCATQEDISYMISNEMFRQFCLPPLVELIDSLDYAMYHLDGGGALTHLDTLLEIPNLRAIQWVPGSGHEDVPQWYDLIRYILSRGKSVEVFAKVEEVDDLVKNVGTRGLLICAYDESADGILTFDVPADEAARLLEKYPQDA